MVQFKKEEEQNRQFEELKDAEAESLTQLLAERYKLPYLDLATTPLNIGALKIIKENVARETKLVAFNVIGKKLLVGILSPQNLKTQEAVENLKRKGWEVNLFLASEKSLEKAWGRYKELSGGAETHSGVLDISSDEIQEFLGKVTNLENIKELIEDTLSAKTSYRISKILEIMLAGALAVKASDIHLEPEESYVRLRYRLDGVLTDILNFDSKTYGLLLSRIKLLSGLKLNITGAAQDGRFSIKMGDGEIEIRTSALPGAYGDTVVLRVLNPKSISVPLEELGIHPRLLSVLLYETSKPNGMILTTGPTGSGKTTTLYAFLKKIHSPGIKIITIENPIEYHLPGIVQTQTDAKKGYTFLEGLRSALRQDPDVIMVGEIRDKETAEIAINAALTGHLVFSTLHTNNAAGAFPRLIDLDVNPKIITSALNIAMAQRLVRKLCSKCKKPKKPKEGEKELIEKTLDTIKDKSYLKDINPEKIWEAVGCKECNFSGFKGRIGIYEAIRADQKIEEAVQKNPSEREIKRAALDQGILDMKQDGIIKVLEGVTSLRELGRVVDLLED